MKNLMRLIRRLFLKDECLNLIHELVIYPKKIKGNRMDPRMDYNKPYMIICFDYIQEPEKNERIIRAVEKRFRDVPEIRGVKLPTVRETLSKRYITTMSFKEKISLS